MITRELVKAEIDKLDAANVELLYKIIKAIHTPTAVIARYSANEPPLEPEKDANFLLSMAGMFDSGHSNTSKQVKAVVSTAILDKYRKSTDDSATG